MDNQMDTGNANMTPLPKKEGGMGATIGIIIIVLVLAVGGIYVWLTKSKPAPVNNDQAMQTTEPTDAKTEALKQTSSSDSASAIEAELSATDTGNASNDLQLQ